MENNKKDKNVGKTEYVGKITSVILNKKLTKDNGEPENRKEIDEKSKGRCLGLLSLA